MDGPELLRHLRKPNESGPDPVGQKAPYRAYTLAREAVRYIEVRSKFPAPALCAPYSAVTTLGIEWRWGSAITLNYGGSGKIEIKGKRLHELAQALKEGRVEWIAEFDPQTNLPFADEGAPYIESVVITMASP